MRDGNPELPRSRSALPEPSFFAALSIALCLFPGCASVPQDRTAASPTESPAALVNVPSTRFFSKTVVYVNDVSTWNRSESTRGGCWSLR